MAERGVISPSPDMVPVMRRLVSALSRVDPKAEIKVETHEGQARFILAATGELLAEYSLTKDA